MIDFTTFQKAVIGGLATSLSIPVIDGNSKEAKPSYPYVSYVFTTTFTPEFENPQYIGSDDTTKTRREDGRISISFNSHSDDYTEAYSNALALAAYFALKGADDLGEENIAIVEIGGIGDRTVMLGDVQERRLGIDVIFRVNSELTITVDTVEDATINTTFTTEGSN